MQLAKQRRMTALCFEGVPLEIEVLEVRLV
jgi:hypothetical protein